MKLNRDTFKKVVSSKEVRLIIGINSVIFSFAISKLNLRSLIFSLSKYTYVGQSSSIGFLMVEGTIEASRSPLNVHCLYKEETTFDLSTASTEAKSEIT